MFLAGAALLTVLFWIFVLILFSVFWIIEIIDVVRRDFYDPTMKIIWLLLIIFTHFIGAAIYFFFGKSQGTLPGEPPRTRQF